jgi:AhpD family alkylhydroperoxidase
MEMETMTSERLNPFALVPDAYKAVSGVESYIRNCGLEKSLIHLVKLRASQINGCAYCLDMHNKEALKDGESAQRLYVLEAWEEVSLFSPRERAALAWTEAVTRIADTRASDAVYQEVRRHFSEAELVNLTTTIGVINLWNRLCISFRIQPPSEKSAAA